MFLCSWWGAAVATSSCCAVLEAAMVCCAARGDASSCATLATCRHESLRCCDSVGFRFCPPATTTQHTPALPLDMPGHLAAPYLPKCSNGGR